MLRCSHLSEILLLCFALVFAFQLCLTIACHCLSLSSLLSFCYHHCLSTSTVVFPPSPSSTTAAISLSCQTLKLSYWQHTSVIASPVLHFLMCSCYLGAWPPSFSHSLIFSHLGTFKPCAIAHMWMCFISPHPFHKLPPILHLNSAFNVIQARMCTLDFSITTWNYLYKNCRNMSLLLNGLI